MNLAGHSWLHFILFFLACSNISATKSAGFASCTSSSFTRSIGYILRGFILGEIDVPDITECKKRCIISANCQSVNILSSVNGGFVCQLNSGRKENGASEQFVQHGAGEYYGLKEKKLCKYDGKICDNVTPWFAFNQSYFQYVRIGFSHFDARAYCKTQNGVLVSISSEEEQTFLHETFIQPDHQATATIRIGMNDIEEEGVYVWEDGSTVTHVRYSPTEPNNVGDEDCMGVWKVDGGFADVLCEGFLGFSFCETDYHSIYS